MARQQDDLFQPSLQHLKDQDQLHRALPWRLKSQFWVAFFGGILAVTTITYINGRRLKLPANKLNLIILIGVVGFLLTIAANYTLLVTETTTQLSEYIRGLRLVGKIIAVLAYLIFYKIQVVADRNYNFFYGENYSSLWRAGLAAVFGLGILQNLLMLALRLLK